MSEQHVTITITRHSPRDGSGFLHRQTTIETDLHPDDIGPGLRQIIRDAAEDLGQALYASAVQVDIESERDNDKRDTESDFDLTPSNEARRGNEIAKSIWQWVQDKKRLDLVPWVKDPDSDDYDPEKVARHEGYQQAISDLRNLIEEKSEELKSSQ